MKHYFFLLIPAILLWACNSETEGSFSKKDSLLEKVNEQYNAGQFIDRIICPGDTSQSYAAYIPQKYKKGIKLPVIFAFDAHARGKLPVDLYKSLAEKYGYIIVGSYNSKNDQDWNTVKNIIRNFVKDVNDRYGMDEKRVYTLGFSGGARLAALVAITYGGINGVIACGAGMPKIDKPIDSRFSFISIAGTSDFNFLELSHLDQLLGNEIPHEFLLFDGKHEWPSADVMEDAFLWLEVNAMKDSLIPRDDTTISFLRHRFENKIADCHKKADTWNEARLYRILIHYLEGLSDVSDLRKNITQIEKSVLYKKSLQLMTDAETRETSMQKELGNQFSIDNIMLLESEIISLKKDTANADNLFRKASSKRLLAFMSMLSYMYTSASVEQNKLKEAKDYLKIYQLVDPENADYFYFSACMSAKNGASDAAFDQLNKAVKLGFYDKDKLISDPSFEELRDKDQFKNIVSSIK